MNSVENHPSRNLEQEGSKEMGLEKSSENPSKQGMMEFIDFKMIQSIQNFIEKKMDDQPPIIPDAGGAEEIAQIARGVAQLEIFEREKDSLAQSR